ncbi:hypothetical protein AAW51_1670 [Caldimonas brevitalea]|uniref:Uncharacterized protein n=1 Tax=Caldimonas brevitalea TaxID=413882 RepID=A0A0G3BLX9_9BURK|nr:hypothetical protein AAW51_1670 [Caldimonas brevitalea]
MSSDQDRLTGDDLDAGGAARARENVMHEIGFVQGRYGRLPSSCCTKTA